MIRIAIADDDKHFCGELESVLLRYMEKSGVKI